ncbi:MAG: hypothetical protein LBS45_00710 [Synergistaceae bacterium]|nr:hypothetical protein [Synergistaceae bacterium]
MHLKVGYVKGRKYLSIAHGFRDAQTGQPRTKTVKIKEQYGRSTELVYCDVTNYYFEIDRPDGLRKKGVSKEHRRDPIVQMGLFMDTIGMPIS